MTINNNQSVFSTSSQNDHSISRFIIILTGALVILLSIVFFTFKSVQIHIIPTQKQFKSLPPTVNYPSDWKIHNSVLGYSVNYPSSWFVSPDPGIDQADIIYNNKEFIDIRSGIKPFDNNERNKYTVLVIQRFNIDDFDIDFTNPLFSIVGETDGSALNVISEEVNDINNVKSLVRIVEIQKEFSIRAYLNNDSFIYILYMSIDSPDDSDRTQIFNQILSTLRFDSGQ